MNYAQVVFNPREFSRLKQSAERELVLGAGADWLLLDCLI